MFASAGVDDFAWLRGHHAPTTLDELRAFARIRGRDAGAGHCLWADERAMQLLAAKAALAKKDAIIAELQARLER